VLHSNVVQWENHAKSLKLEEQTLAKIKSRIDDKVMKNSGTWIDWQYLLKAAELLMKVFHLCKCEQLVF
jgi:ariadne-2